MVMCEHASSPPRKAKRGTKLFEKVEVLVLKWKILGILKRMYCTKCVKMCKETAS